MSVTSRAGTRAPSVRERASDRLQCVPHSDPVETVHAGALVTVAGPAPDLATQKLMPVALAVWKPDLRLGGSEDADGGDAKRGSGVKRAPIHRDERIQRRDHAPGGAERKPSQDRRVLARP